MYMEDCQSTKKVEETLGFIGKPQSSVTWSSVVDGDPCLKYALGYVRRPAHLTTFIQATVDECVGA